MISKKAKFGIGGLLVIVIAVWFAPNWRTIFWLPQSFYTDRFVGCDAKYSDPFTGKIQRVKAEGRAITNLFDFDTNGELPEARLECRDRLDIKVGQLEERSRIAEAKRKERARKARIRADAEKKRREEAEKKRKEEMERRAGAEKTDAARGLKRLLGQRVCATASNRKNGLCGTVTQVMGTSVRIENYNVFCGQGGFLGICTNIGSSDNNCTGRRRLFVDEPYRNPSNLIIPEYCLDR